MKAIVTDSFRTAVLDDDPTGTQTVHGVPVFTRWGVEDMKEALDRERLCFILTNSRACTVEQTRLLHREVMTNLLDASAKLDVDFDLISRCDSTLRGHYAVEMDTIRNVLLEHGKSVDGEIIAPFFLEGGRITSAFLKISLREMKYQNIDMSAMAESIIAELRSTEPERHVEVHIDKDMKATADASLVRIALANLIGNSWKYTSKKEFAFISIESNDGKGETIFSVKDNGSGFDMKFAQNLFTPFRRLHSESEIQGSGIGLSIVDRIIRRHNGRVWAESEVNKGATFYFALPK